MKNLFFLLFLALTIIACEETPVDIGIDGMESEDDPPPIQKKVIIEEFTGNKCNNCPPGSKLLLDLQDIHGERFIPVSLHASDWAVPHANTEIDFRTQDAENIYQFLGLPAGFPTGVVVREPFAGSYGLQLGSALWPGVIDLVMAEEASAKVEIFPSFDVATRTATIEVTTEFILPESIAQDDQTMLTVYFLEDHIVGYQETPDGPVPDYDHRHVFRTALTSHNGEEISLDGQVGIPAERSYSMTIPDDWNVDNVQVVAFIHNSGSSKEIYQAEAVDLLN